MNHGQQTAGLSTAASALTLAVLVVALAAVIGFYIVQMNSGSAANPSNLAEVDVQETTRNGTPTYELTLHSITRNATVYYKTANGTRMEFTTIGQTVHLVEGKHYTPGDDILVIIETDDGRQALLRQIRTETTDQAHNNTTDGLNSPLTTPVPGSP